MTRLIRVCFVIASIVLTAACDGGGGLSLSDGAEIGSDTPQGDGFGSEPAAHLTGLMVGRRSGVDHLGGLDLETGRYFRLSDIDRLIGTGALRSETLSRAQRDPSVLSGFVLTVSNCSSDQDDVTCIFFLDRDGRVTDFFSIFAEFAGPAKVSFDGSHVAILLTDRADGPTLMRIYTRDGDVVSEHAQTGAMDRDGPYDWLPDGRLVYARVANELLGDFEPTGLFITRPFDAVPDRRIVLPDFYQGTLSNIETVQTSRDGSELLMNLRPSVGAYRPIIMDVETLDVRQLIVRQDDSVTDVQSVSWGSGGEWVYVTVPTSRLLSGTSLDSSQGDTVVFIGNSTSLFAYRNNGQTHPMPLDPDDISDAVRLVPTESASNPGGQLGGGQYSGSTVWIP